nr:hypothetical protein [Chloroflexia bacterium]
MLPDVIRRIIVREVPISPAPSPSASALYRRRRDEFEAQRLTIHKRWNLIANLRLLSFAALAAAGWWAWFEPRPVKWVLVAVLA